MGGFLSVLAVLAAVVWFVFPPNAKLEVCNAAPYPTDQIAFSLSGGTLTAVSEKRHLASGECFEVSEWVWFGTPEFYVHSAVPYGSRRTYELVRSVKNSQPDGNNPLDSDTIQYWGVIYTCLQDESPKIGTVSNITESCPQSRYIVGLQPAFSMGRRTKWSFVWEHPDLSLIKYTKSIDADIKSGLQYARRLEESINRQLFYEREWRGSAPFIAGGRMEDENGPLNPGVWLSSVPSKNVFGEPQLLRSGDAIIKVNGTEVFGESDLAQLLINHGLSRDHGIESLVKYEILRGTQRLQLESPYYFNERYHEHTSDQSGLAFWYGVGDAVAFGQTPWALCYGNNAVRGTLNGVSKVWEFGRSQITGETYNSRNELQIGYIDAEECKWQKEQARGLARQKELGIYVNSQWFAIITPSAVRLVGKNAVRGSLANSGFKAATGVRLADAVLEAGESALWSLGTSPPGTPLSKRVGDTATLAGLGAVGGYLSSSLFGKAQAVAKKRG
mmetsp:Transcript_10077/g.17696  ORF Transcript_10077/g.17696 Transcript_10077/m.17696 type:complete len:501 (+) Transcript_10077:1904-3406(+)